jgi:2-iminobutanoate/2-iminopropanoate deaminase
MTPTLSNRERMSNRKSIEVDGLQHGGNPIPLASRVGNVVMTGGVGGSDPVTGKAPDDEAAQVANAFKNIERILEAAGASMDDVVKLSIAVKSLALRDEINKQWVAYFPDEHSRPARHVTQYDHFRRNVVIQLEAYAVVG